MGSGGRLLPSSAGTSFVDLFPGRAGQSSHTHTHMNIHVQGHTHTHTHIELPMVIKAARASRPRRSSALRLLTGRHIPQIACLWISLCGIMRVLSEHQVHQSACLLAANAFAFVQPRLEVVPISNVAAALYWPSSTLVLQHHAPQHLHLLLCIRVHVYLAQVCNTMDHVNRAMEKSAPRGNESALAFKKRLRRTALRTPKALVKKMVRDREISHAISTRRLSLPLPASLCEVRLESSRHLTYCS